MERLSTPERKQERGVCSAGAPRRGACRIGVAFTYGTMLSPKAMSLRNVQALVRMPA